MVEAIPGEGQRDPLTHDRRNGVQRQPVAGWGAASTWNDPTRIASTSPSRSPSVVNTSLPIGMTLKPEIRGSCMVLPPRLDSRAHTMDVCVPRYQEDARMPATMEIIRPGEIDQWDQA